VSETPIVEAPGGIRALMRQALALYRARLPLYLALVAIPVVPVGIALVALAAAVPNPSADTNNVTLISAAAEFLLVVPLAQAGVAYAVKAQVAGARPSLLETLRFAMPRFSALVGTIILSSLVIIVGLVALVIPGLVMAIWFQFAGQVVVLEDLTYWQALRRCRDLVRGVFWRTLAAVLAIGVIAFLAGVLVSTVFGGFALSGDASARSKLVLPLAADIPSFVLVLPFSTIALTLVYLRLRARRPLP
jgi:hypothetical protein